METEKERKNFTYEYSGQLIFQVAPRIDKSQSTQIIPGVDIQQLEKKKQ